MLNSADNVIIRPSADGKIAAEAVVAECEKQILRSFHEKHDIAMLLILARRWGNKTFVPILGCRSLWSTEMENGLGANYRRRAPGRRRLHVLQDYQVISQTYIRGLCDKSFHTKRGMCKLLGCVGSRRVTGCSVVQMQFSKNLRNVWVKTVHSDSEAEKRPQKRKRNGTAAVPKKQIIKEDDEDEEEEEDVTKDLDGNATVGTDRKNTSSHTQIKVEKEATSTNTSTNNASQENINTETTGVDLPTIKVAEEPPEDATSEPQPKDSSLD
ncbi:hypothetical protein QBC38DRAFT_443881 [Podospora fimiseda]|uniref:Uncharacterized protein n=1 Tax=Podospora fimiseda TaxID=252190 RepID=A0AAN7BPY6_9PEZI|nr:hypothetical protein QBC38DRAFT_443881 [Podospora fimiseda]